MQMSAADNRSTATVSTEKIAIKKLVLLIILFTVLIAGRALSNSFFYVFAAVSLFVFVISKVSYCIPLLFYLLPFASILKQDLNSISIFTLLFFISVLKMVIKKKRFDVDFLIILAAFSVYCLGFSGLGQLTTIITMAAGMLMLYCLRDIDTDSNAVVVSYSVGICLASILAECRSFLPIIGAFVQDSTLKLGQNELASRFSGLQGNPNYFTLDIIIALASIIVLMHLQKSSLTKITCFALLSVFGLMSVSKSFVLTFGLLIFLWFIVSMKQGASTLIKFVFIIGITSIVIYYFAYDYVNAYLLRFINDRSGDLDSITTGRTGIWKAYIDEILHNTRILFFGNGLNSIANIGKGTHNTYLETLYSLGIIGSILYLATVKISMGKIITKRIVWIPVLMLLVRMFAIGILTYDNLFFYLAIILLIAKSSKTAVKNIA